MTSSPLVISQNILHSVYQKSAASPRYPGSLLLGDGDGFYHHHYGLGDYDPSVLAGPMETREDRILREMHRLEHAQAVLLLDHLSPVSQDSRLLDAGSGRGGSSFLANLRFGCRVDGVSISEFQVGFANSQAEQLGVADRVKFHFLNMLDTRFETGSMRGIWTNESTMYVDLRQLFEEFARLLPRGGRYVCITGCYNEAIGGRSRAVRQIDAHYICNIHPRSAYFKAMAANNLVPIAVVDLTPQAIPYWQLCAQCASATGVEDSFLTAYREGSFHYLLIAADRI